jgi:hypothetical protein
MSKASDHGGIQAQNDSLRIDRNLCGYAFFT